MGSFGAFSGREDAEDVGSQQHQVDDADRRFVRPVPYVMMATMKPRAISTVAPADIPSSSGCPIQNEAIATTGTESPMEATALPSARLMLACSWRRGAARIAAAVSGNNTIVAMITPTIASGAPAARTPASTAGAKLFASSTTDKSATNSMPTDASAIRPLGLACSMAPPSYIGRK